MYQKKTNIWFHLNFSLFKNVFVSCFSNPSLNHNKRNRILIISLNSLINLIIYLSFLNKLTAEYQRSIYYKLFFLQKKWTQKNDYYVLCVWSTKIIILFWHYFDFLNFIWFIVIKFFCISCVYDVCICKKKYINITIDRKKNRLICWLIAS